MPTAGHAWSSKEIISMEGALIYGFFQKAKRIFRDLGCETFTHPRSMATLFYLPLVLPVDPSPKKVLAVAIICIG